MEIILVVLQPKQNIGSHDYRSKFYNVLLLDHKTTTGDKSKPTKYLPTFPLKNTGEEPRDEVLGNLYRLTGGEHGGIKGERALLIPWNSRDFRASLERFHLFCVPVNSRDKLNKAFVEKSPNSPGFFSLDTMVETLNSGMTNYPPPTQTFISQLESWLKEKHSRPGSLDILFQNRADYRIKFSINNPAFLPSRHEVSPESNGSIIDDSPDDIRLTANEALAKELAIEKCDIVVINPIFGSQMPYKTNVNNFVRNMYWPSTPPDYDSRRSSDTSSIEGVGIGTFLSSMDDQYQLHKVASEGNCELLLELINRGFPVDDTDIKYLTPLHYASARGHKEAVQVLLRAGADPNARTDNKSTALHLASMYGNVQVADALLKHPKINMEIQDRHGKTALNYCEETQYWAQKRIGELIRAASNSNTLEIEIYLTDKTVKKLKLVNGTNTTVKHLNLQLFKDYNMSEELSEIFTIWICSNSLELQLRQDHCPMIELQVWNRNVKMLTDANPGNEDPQLRWRRNAKIGLKEEKGVTHPQAVHILFHEAYNNYIQALYPCKDQDVLTFASILIYKEQKGEFDSASAKTHVTSKNLQKLVPGPMLKVKSSNWASRILHHYKDFCPHLANTLEVRNSTHQQRDQALKRQFLDYCRHLTVYGSAFFRGMLLSTQGKGGQNQTACHIGVNDVGIHIINSQTGVMLHSFKYSEIKWKHEDGNSLEIVVVRLEPNADKNITREVKLRTKQAGLILNLMEKLKQMHAFKDRSVNLVYSRKPAVT